MKLSLPYLITIKVLSYLIPLSLSNDIYYNSNLNNRNISYSKEFDLISHLNLKDGSKLFNKGQEINVKINLTNQNVDVKQNITTKLNSFNSLYTIDTALIKGIQMDNNYLIDGRDFYVNYTKSRDVISSLSFESKYNQLFKDNNNYYAECLIQESSLSYINNRINDFSINEVIKIRTGSFGIKKETESIVFFYYYNNQIINVKDFKDFYIENTNPKAIRIDLTNIKFKKLFLIDQPYISNIFLIAEGYNQTNKNLYVFEIIISSFGEISNTYLYTIIDIFQPSFTAYQSLNISSIGFTEDVFLIGSNLGLFLYNKKYSPILDNNYTVIEDRQYIFGPLRNYTTYKSIYGKDEIMNIGDILVLKYTIYLLVKGYGIVPLQINSLGFFPEKEMMNLLLYDKLEKFDYVVNPLLNTKYLIIIIKEDSNREDLLIELNIDDEFNPKINKLFMSNRNITTENYISYDLFLGVIYDYYTNSLILFRKGLLNNIPFQSYILDLKDLFYPSNKNSIKISTFYNSDKNKNELALIDLSSNRVLLIGNITLPETEVVCSFNKNGNFTVIIEKNGEICYDSIIENYAFSYCKYWIYLQFNSVGEDMSDLTALGIVLGSLLGFLLFVILIFLTFKTQCCTDFSMFSKGKSTPTRQELYKDEFIKRKNKGTTNGSIYDNSNYYQSNFKNTITEK